MLYRIEVSRHVVFMCVGGGWTWGEGEVKRGPARLKFSFKVCVKVMLKTVLL